VAGGGSVARDPDQIVFGPGDTVTLTASADPGWTFANWSGDLMDTHNPVTITITGTTSITATFSRDEYTLTVNADGEGSVDVDPAGPYHYGDVITLTADADPGWTFANWSGDLDTIASPGTITMDASKSVTATFTQNTYTLTVDSFGNGSVVSEPAQETYHYGDVVTLTAGADLGWTFAGWSGALSGTDNPATITMDGDKSVVATFSEDEYSITVHTDGDGSADIDPAGPYNYGDVVTLTASAATGWTFAGWSGHLSGSTNPVTITIDGPKSVMATFAQNEYALTITTNGAGSVDVDSAGPYNYGDVVTLTASADPGWTFAGWLGDLSGADNPATLMIDGNKSVTATFVEEAPVPYSYSVFLPFVTLGPSR
jgi:uncharacterized repeat protein (TIGR02543 family)